MGDRKRRRIDTLHLVKAIDSYDYMEDFGLLREGRISFYENGDTAMDRVAHRPVVKLSALWLDKDLFLLCKIADTDDKKRIGLQQTRKLKANEAMYFPYVPYTNVSFHQGTVKFPLDIMFLRDDRICKIEADTKVGSTEHWSCRNCTGVVETRAGWCFENGVDVGDRVSLFAHCQEDLDAFETEKTAGVAFADLPLEEESFSPFPLKKLFGRMAYSLTE